jgi:hypothetical protein
MSQNAPPRPQGPVTTKQPEPLPLPLQKEIKAPPLPNLNGSGQSVDANLQAWQEAQLSLFRDNFNLLFQQVAQWVAVARQRDQEMELTLGKVRAFAELAERIVQTADSQLEKLVALNAATIQLYERIQNPPKENPEG